MRRIILAVACVMSAEQLHPLNTSSAAHAPPMKQETKEPRALWVRAYMRWPGIDVFVSEDQIADGAAPSECPIDMELFARYYNDVFFVAEYAHDHAKWCEEVEWVMQDKVWFGDYKREAKKKAECWSALAHAFSYLADVNDGRSAQRAMEELRSLLGEENYKAGIMPVVFYYHEKE